MQVLNVSIVENLTNAVWEKWQVAGYTTQPYALTWMEINHLANHFLKICREQNRDYREFDFSMLLDHKLRFEENRAEIDNELRGLNSETENSKVNKLKDYFSEEKIKEKFKGYTQEEKSAVEQVEQKNKTLEKKLKEIVAKVETQQPPTLDTTEIKEEIQQFKTDITARLEAIPNSDQLVKALLKSENFKELGKALAPFIEAKPIKLDKPKKQFSLPSWLKPKHEIKLLDAFAGFMVTVMFLGFSYGLTSAFGFGWGSIVGLGLIWLVYVVVLRLVVGGLLD